MPIGPLTGCIKIVSPNVFPPSSTHGKAGGKRSRMSSKTAVEYPNIPSILALVGGALIVLFDIFLVTISIVTMSAVLLRLKPNQRQTWGILVLVFSILGFFGFGGFIVGSVLGIVGG